MARRSIMERHQHALEREVGDLTGAPFVDKLTAVHHRTVDVMTELLELGEKFSNKDTPPALRTLMGMLRRLKPMMLEQLSDVEPAVIVEFMEDLREKMDSIIREGTTGDGTADARVDLATGT